MSIPLFSGKTPDEEIELASEEEREGAVMESEKERLLELCLSERQVMETRQELNRIELIGRVHRLLNQRFAAKIGRNLQAKVVNGPLGKEKDSSISTTPQVQSPLTSPKPIPEPPPFRIQSDNAASASRGKFKKLSKKSTKVPSKRGWVVGNHALNEVGSTSFEDSNKKELEDLEELKVVKTHLADRRKASHLARRMFNQRVNNRKTNTSILLSGIEPDQEQAMEAMRNMNRFVLDKFLQTQSQNRRVLERLNSKQVSTIADIEAGKAAKLRRRSDTSVHEALILEETEEKEKEERKKGIKRPYKRASISSFTDLTTLTGKAPPTGSRTVDALKKSWEKGVKYFHLKKESVSASVSKSMSKYKGRKSSRGSRRVRRRRAHKEEMVVYDYDDEAVSKSSGTEEVESTTPTHGGSMLETLFEKPLPAKQSIESEEETSPLSSSGGAFIPSSGPPFVQPPFADKQQTPTIAFSLPQSPPTSAPPPLSHDELPPVSIKPAPPPLQTQDAPPTIKLGPPPPPPPPSAPFEEHGLPTSLFLGDASLSNGATTLEEPSNLQAQTPSTYDAITPSGYQADSEEYTGFPAPFPHRTEPAHFSEDLMQESPAKRARIDDGESSLEDTDSCSCEAISVAQSPFIPKSVQVKVQDSFNGKEEVEALGVNYSFRGESKPSVVENSYRNGRVNVILSESSQAEVTVKQADTPGHRVLQEETSDGEEEKVEVKEKEPTSERKTPSPSRLLASKKSSSLESKSGSEQNPPSSSSRMKRYFSFPYISTSNDLEPQMLPRFKPRSSLNRNHAYYTPVEMDEEFNPFNYEFENGDSFDVVSKGGRIESDTMDFAGSQKIPSRSSSLRSPNQSPRVHARHPSAEAKRKSTIPSSAYNNLRFLNYMQMLSHDPTYDDYLAFQVVERLVVIGERIEERYKDKIDFALDNIFMDIMKKPFSFESFRAVAGRLFFEAKRVQDSLFMIPLFARRLKEILKPEMKGYVNDYTEMFMDNVVTKYLMSMGGWENVIENYEDGEVYDEHPDHYSGIHEGGHLVENGVDAPLYYHQRGASNYDHLYDGTAEYQLPPTAYHPPLHAHNSHNVDRTQYRLETYERAEFQPTPAEEVRVLNEDRFESYLARHHPYLFEPGYLRRVNSVDVLFQDNIAKFEDVLSSFPEPEDYYDCPQTPADGETPSNKRRPTRKRSSQMSLARSLSLDSLASPGLTSGAFCMTPSASSTFLTRRSSRSASRSPAPPAESPTKRVFPTHSPIHEHKHIDSFLPDTPTNDKSITVVSNDPNQHSRTLVRPRPLILPHTPEQHPPIDVPVSQISVSSPTPPISTTTPPSAVSQSSGDNYDSLYDSGPSRTNTGESADSANSKSNKSVTKSENGSVSNSVHSRSQNGRDRNRNGKEQEDTKKWVVPVVAVVTVSAVVLIAGYFYLKRKS